MFIQECSIMKKAVIFGIRSSWMRFHWIQTNVPIPMQYLYFRGPNKCLFDHHASLLGSAVQCAVYCVQGSTTFITDVSGAKCCGFNYHSVTLVRYKAVFTQFVVTALNSVQNLCCDTYLFCKIEYRFISFARDALDPNELFREPSLGYTHQVW